MFAALEAAVKADVEAFLRRGNVNASAPLKPWGVRSPTTNAM